MTRLEALRALKEAVEAGEWLVGATANVPELHTDLTWKAFNGSLDAARAMHEAVLPDEGWHVEWAAKYPSLAFKPAAWCASVGWGARHAAYAACPARAWLLAILAALIAQEQEQ